MSVEKSTNSSILGLSHLLIQVSDLAAAEHFYCQVMGLTVKSRSTFAGDRPLIVTHQGIGLTLLPNAGAGPLPADRRNVEHVALWVSGMEALITKLQEAGFRVDGPKSNEYGLSMSVRDPDGNRVECIEQL